MSASKKKRSVGRPPFFLPLPIARKRRTKICLTSLRQRGGRDPSRNVGGDRSSGNNSREEKRSPFLCRLSGADDVRRRAPPDPDDIILHLGPLKCTNAQVTMKAEKKVSSLSFWKFVQSPLREKGEMWRKGKRTLFQRIGDATATQKRRVATVQYSG